MGREGGGVDVTLRALFVNFADLLELKQNPNELSQQTSMKFEFEPYFAHTRTYAATMLIFSSPHHLRWFHPSHTHIPLVLSGAGQWVSTPFPPPSDDKPGGAVGLTPGLPKIKPVSADYHYVSPSTCTWPHQLKSPIRHFALWFLANFTCHICAINQPLMNPQCGHITCIIAVSKFILFQNISS